jgi:hypothetical protein
MLYAMLALDQETQPKHIPTTESTWYPHCNRLIFAYFRQPYSLLLSIVSAPCSNDFVLMLGSFTVTPPDRARRQPRMSTPAQPHEM